MKYKVGDKVRIKSLEWYNENKNKNGYVENSDGNGSLCFLPLHEKYCGKIFVIDSIWSRGDVLYLIAAGGLYWEDWMFDETYNGEDNMGKEKKEGLNLCEILKGCEGMRFYLTTHGYCTLDEIKTGAYDYPIRLKVCDKENNEDTRMISAKGTASVDHYGECILFPSKSQRDWSKFEKPIPVDTPMMVCNNRLMHCFSIRFYAGVRDGKHVCFHDGLASKTAKKGDTGVAWKYIIPFNKFDPNSLEKSLKHNIQK